MTNYKLGKSSNGNILYKGKEIILKKKIKGGRIIEYTYLCLSPPLEDRSIINICKEIDKKENNE